MRWIIHTELDTTDPAVSHMVSGWYVGDTVPFPIYYRKTALVAGPFTTSVAEASFFRTKADAESQAIIVAGKYPYFLGKLKVGKPT